MGRVMDVGFGTRSDVSRLNVVLGMTLSCE